MEIPFIELQHCNTALKWLDFVSKSIDIVRIFFDIVRVLESTRMNLKGISEFHDRKVGVWANESLSFLP